MKLLSERKKMVDEGKLKMCTAEYDGSWLPYQQPFQEVTFDWLLEEITYDDCTRKEDISKYLSLKINEMQRDIFELKEFRKNLNRILLQFEK
ncbi:HAD family hydrolase [Anaeromicropila herbilytica]|uniref:Uncharacterized protein n=1 Tax=Anaeromicropila herbilytica TaxID=2785025 RepID=A0A7R7IBD2_9FIRM|nr:hypothetical protein [Anaeromicropila herbilytica]BCN29508.1 hypothetical protein bsdtb5_08030 [Anaeromicropila herbilytica]